MKKSLQLLGLFTIILTLTSCSNKDNICPFITADWATAAIALVGFVVTLLSFRRSNREKSIANVIALKAEMRLYDDIYFKLLNGSSATPITTGEVEFGKLVSYLGLFEIAYRMMKIGNLSNDEFRTFFHYRLENISRNDSIKQMLNTDREAWSNLITLMKDFDLPINN